MRIERLVRVNSNNASTMIMPHVQSAIRDFHGIEPTDTSEAWFRELETMKAVNNWSDAIAFNVGKAHLKNAALKWYLTKVNTVNDFKTFRDAFKSTFTSFLSKSDKIRAMTARVQKPKEALQEYVLDKIWQCDGLDFTVAEIRDEVASGLWSRELANYIIAKDYKSTDVMMQDMLRFEKLDAMRRERIASERRSSSAADGRRQHTSRGYSATTKTAETDCSTSGPSGGNAIRW